MSKQLLCS